MARRRTSPAPPIILSRSSGRDSRPMTRMPATVPAGVAHISSPTVSGPPPRVCAYGTASPSGTTANPASQPNRTSVRAAGRRKISAASLAEGVQQGPGRLFPAVRPWPHPPGDQRGRQAERQCVQGQRTVRTQGRHQDPAAQEPGDLTGLEGHVAQRRAHREPFPGEYLREHGRPRRGERWPEQHGEAQQRAGPGQGHAGQRHQLHQPAANEVQGDHDLAPRERVHHARKQRAAQDRRQVGQGVRERGESR